MESKLALTERLRAEGRWPAFLCRREQLKAGGMAAADAWAKARDEFGPLEPVTTGVSERQADPLTAELAETAEAWSTDTGKRASRAKIVEWVAQNLDALWELAKDAAPCPAAGNLLAWVRGIDRCSAAERGRRQEAFWSMWARGIPARVEADREERDFSDCQNVLEVLQSIRKAKGFPDPGVDEEAGRAN